MSSQVLFKITQNQIEQEAGFKSPAGELGEGVGTFFLTFFLSSQKHKEGGEGSWEARKVFPPRPSTKKFVGA